MDFLSSFWLRHTFQEEIAPKSIERDRDNLRVKLLAFNVVFTSLNSPLCSRNSPYGGVKLGHPVQNTRIRQLIPQQPLEKVAPSGLCECIVLNVSCWDRRA